MAIEFILPELGENIESGDVVRVAVEKGQSVNEGQSVIELETDKAVIEVPSNVSGIVQEVKVKQGQKVKVGDVIFVADGNGTQTQPAAPKSVTQQPAAVAEESKASAPDAQQGESAVMHPASSSGEELELRLPSLGENIEAGDVVRVAVKAGDSISEGQSIIELETDKAVIEVPSTVTGIVKEVQARQGQKLKVGDVVLTLQGGAEKGEAAVSNPVAVQPQPSQSVSMDDSDTSSTQFAREAYQSARRVEGKTEHEAFPRDAHVPVPQQLVPSQIEKHTGPENRTPVPASPKVRRLAREIGIDIYMVQGTGPGGRVSEADVKAYAKSLVTSAGQMVTSASAGAARPVPKLPDFRKWGEIETVPMRPIRRKTAEHLSEAWTLIPHVTQHDKADVTELEELRKRFSPKAEMAGGKMTMTAIALKVVASALKTFPQFNASIDSAGESVIYKKYINIGVAVDTDRGLLVPVIRDVDHKNIVELATELTAISKKAKDRKLTPDDMEGGTFTITNLGGIGGTSFTPIVNHPEVAILGMSRSRKEPVWVNNQFEPRLILPLSLSYDHRLIDGADAARFVRWIVEALEQPFLLSVQG